MKAWLARAVLWLNRLCRLQHAAFTMTISGLVRVLQFATMVACVLTGSGTLVLCTLGGVHPWLT
jgi:hypothetical protein